MNAVFKIFTALAAALFAVLAAQTAAANDRPDYCAIDHDHRSHSANYYDYYDGDRYSRAGDYRGGDYRDRDYRDTDYRNGDYRGGRDHRRGRDRYRGDRYGYRPRSEVVFRRDIDLRRYSAYVTVVEENYWTRSGRVQRVCSIVPKGRDAYHVPRRALSRIAHDNCSHRARIQYL